MRLADAVSRRSRRRKARWFEEHLEPGRSVLLVGATAGGGPVNNLVETSLARRGRTCALVYEDGRPELSCTVVRGDALRLPFDDSSFDYVVSNAVIEHVGSTAGSQMVSESRRVARVAAVHTTPYRWFPVETHSKVPLLHWLPRRWQAPAFRAVGVPWFNPEEYWLYDRRSLRALGGDPQIVAVGPISLVGWWPAADG